MQDPPKRRVDGARALARAFVVQAEGLTRIKNLTRPRYGKFTLVSAHDVISKVFEVCRETSDAIFMEDQPMPAMPDKRVRYSRLTKEMWTARGSNGKDEPMDVGVFGSERDAGQWCDRQNETQHQQEWGRGSAGPMRFKPAPIYQARGLDPQVPVYPERQWERPSDAD